MRRHLISLLFVYLIATTFCSLPFKESLCGPNNKVKLSETVLDANEVDDWQLHFVSDDNQIIFLRTKDGSLYRSADEGHSWTKQTVPEIMQKIDMNPGGIRQMYNKQSSIDKKVTVYILAAQGTSLWVSTNDGVSYSHYDIPTDMNNLSINPKNPSLVIGTRIRGTTSEAWISKDSGATWTLMVEGLPVKPRIEWNIFDSPEINGIFMQKLDQKGFYKLEYSNDYFRSTEAIPVDQIHSWSMYAPNKFVIQRCKDSACSYKEFHVSVDSGKTFNIIEFPESRRETPGEITVWELSDDAIWVYVHHACSNGNCWGDIFHSNSVDNDFTLALQYQKQYQFTKFNSIDGVYLANQYITKGGVPESNDLIRSLITFNKGSEWSILQAPDRDANGQPTNCKIEDGCSLHLQGWGAAGAFIYFYSVPTAVGLMIASGNIGQRLQNHEDEISTYVSWNGGVDWKEVRKRDYVPEIGDYGSIVVLVKEDGVTDEVVYTTTSDEWSVCKIASEAYDVSNIRVSQGWDSRRFVLYGKRVVNGTMRAVVVQLNFDDEFSGKCTADDFTTWSPTDEHGNCVMGAKTSYNVRKKGRNCYLGEDFKSNISVTPCPCTDADYECDHCFYRTDLSSPCILDSNCAVPDLPAAPAGCNVSYEVDKGYRLVSNTKCIQAGTKKPKGIVPCDVSPPNSDKIRISGGLSAIPVIIIMIILILGGAGGVWYLFKNNDSFYHFVRDNFGIEDTNRSPVRYQNVEQGQSLADNIDADD